MLDFTSALYLGLRHPSRSLLPWSSLTTGAPAALVDQSEAVGVARDLAALMGCEQGALSPSTLHLFWDLFGLLAKKKVALFMDSGVYPIVRWGIERGAALGAPVKSFPHHDVKALRRALRGHPPRRGRPIVVTDAFCPGCGGPAPLAAYLESARAFGGWLILDDTQALGIFGRSPGSGAPYGQGGGGMLRRSNIGGPDVLVVSSLAKGFGVPLAVLAGSRDTLGWFEEESETRVHCSPPSAAVIRAGQRALRINRDDGDNLRFHLADLVRRFRSGLQQLGITAQGGLFPVQTLARLPGSSAPKLHDGLLRQGIRAVLHQASNSRKACISFLITAGHGFADIDQAVEVIGEVVSTVGSEWEQGDVMSL